MSRFLYALIISVIGLISPAVALSANFEASYCNLKEKSFYPIKFVEMAFQGMPDMDIMLADDATGAVICGGETVTTTSLQLIYNEMENVYYPLVVAQFDEALCLPTGKSYNFVIEAGALYSVSDPAEKSPEYRYDFEVPAALEYSNDAMDERVASEHNFNFFFSSAIEPLEGCKGLLYREDVLVGEYTLDISSDWDAGTASLNLSGTTDYRDCVNFENDVPYKAVIPAGSICAVGRQDIVNEEIVYEFTGAYETPEPVEVLYPVWFNQAIDERTCTIGEVTIGYDREVRLSPEPLVALIQYPDEGEPEVVVAVEPTLAQEGDYWVVRADFQNHPVPTNVGLMVVLKKGSVVTANGIICYTPELNFDLGNFSGLATPEAEQQTGEGALYDLHGRRIAAPQPGSLYISGGRTRLAR